LTQRDLVRLATLEHEVAAVASPAYAARLPRGYGVRDVDWIAWAPPFEQLSPNTSSWPSISASCGRHFTS
jgi:hypothetical protein